MNMRIHPRYLIATVAVLLGAAGLHAQTTGTNGCTITIPVVNLLSIYGTAVLNVPTANAACAIAGGLRHHGQHKRKHSSSPPIRPIWRSPWRPQSLLQLA